MPELMTRLSMFRNGVESMVPFLTIRMRAMRLEEFPCSTMNNRSRSPSGAVASIGRCRPAATKVFVIDCAWTTGDTTAQSSATTNRLLSMIRTSLLDGYRRWNVGDKGTT